MNTDPRFATNSARLANTDEAERPIREFIAAKDFARCLALFEQAEVTAAPVYDIDQFVDDPHVRERRCGRRARRGGRQRDDAQYPAAALGDAGRAAHAGAEARAAHGGDPGRVGVDAADLENLRSQGIV